MRSGIMLENNPDLESQGPGKCETTTPVDGVKTNIPSGSTSGHGITVKTSQLIGPNISQLGEESYTYIRSQYFPYGTGNYHLVIYSGTNEAN
jgi:hypothetical protein